MANQAKRMGDKMNNRVAKKIRQYTRRNWREFYGDILELLFRDRLGIAWYLVTHSKPPKEKRKQNEHQL